jgi:hypothetical protein
MPIKDKAARKAYHKKYHEKWYEENKEKRTAQILEYEKTKPEEWRKAIGRKSNLKLRYNLTPQEYETKLASQDYKCALCGRDANDNVRRGKVEPLCVDHCHTTKKLRDLLCFHCNSFLGHAKDNPEVLTKAAQYLIDHKNK